MLKYFYQSDSSWTLINNKIIFSLQVLQLLSLLSCLDLKQHPLIFWSRERERGSGMVLLRDGSSEYVAHVWCKLSQKTIFRFAARLEEPSYKRTMGLGGTEMKILLLLLVCRKLLNLAKPSVMDTIICNEKKGFRFNLLWE